MSAGSVAAWTHNGITLAAVLVTIALAVGGWTIAEHNATREQLTRQRIDMAELRGGQRAIVRAIATAYERRWTSEHAAEWAERLEAANPALTIPSTASVVRDLRRDANPFDALTENTPPPKGPPEKNSRRPVALHKPGPVRYDEEPDHDTG